MYTFEHSSHIPAGKRPITSELSQGYLQKHQGNNHQDVEQGVRDKEQACKKGTIIRMKNRVKGIRNMPVKREQPSG